MVAPVQINLSNQLADGVAQFTGRTWLLPKLLAWWNQETERMLLLTGAPGTGKSMIAAWLAGHGPIPDDPSARTQLLQIRGLVSAVHLCQASSRNITPQAFASCIAQQLTDSTAGFGDALSHVLDERISIVGKASTGPVAPGSSVAGVSIGHIDASGLGDELSFDRWFVRPLKEMYTRGYSIPILLVVDALDEAQTYTERVTLPNLLSRLSDLPRQVRILATTRDEPRVLKFFRGVRALDLNKHANPDEDDVLAFAKRRLTALHTIKEIEREKFAHRLAFQANGVFLYAAMVLDELDRQLPSSLPLLDQYGLPSGLSGLYHDFLTRELGRDERGWVDDFRPILGLISVAQDDGLTTSQIARILKREPDEISDKLRICKQYLHGTLPNGPFRSFHKSFSDYLLNNADNSDHQIDGRQMHQKIAAHYSQYGGSDWSRCDSYGILNILRHALFGNTPSIINNLFADLRFLIKTDPSTALEAAPLITDDKSAQIAKIFGQVAHHFQDSGEGDRLSYLELAASQGKVTLDVDKIPQGKIDRRWGVAWTDCQPAAPYIVLKGHGGTISAITSGSDGDRRFIVTGDSNGEIILWSQITGARWKTLPERRSSEIRALNFCKTADKLLLIVGDAEGTVECWDLDNEQCIWEDQIHWYVNDLTVVRAKQSHLVISTSGGQNGMFVASQLLTGRTVRWFEVDDNKRTLMPGVSNLGARSVAFFSNQTGSFLIAGYEDGILRIWDCKTGLLKLKRKLHEKSIDHVEAFQLSNEAFVFTATRGLTIACWKFPGLEKVFENTAYHKENVQPAAATGLLTDKKIIYLAVDNSLVLIDARNGQEVTRIEGIHSNWIRALAHEQCGDGSGQIMMGGGDRIVYVLATNSLGPSAFPSGARFCLPVFKIPTAIGCVKCDGRELLACGFDDGSLHLRDLQTGSAVGRSWQLPGAVREIRYLEHGGATIIACLFSGGIWLWHESDDVNFTIKDSDQGRTTAFAVGIRLGEPALAVGTDQGVVGIQSLTSRENSVQVIGWHTYRSANKANLAILRPSISDLAFVKGGAVDALVSAGWEDRKIKIWNLENCSLTATIENAHREYITRMAVADFDELKLLSVSLDHSCKSWDTHDFSLDTEYIDCEMRGEENTLDDDDIAAWYVDVANGEWNAQDVVAVASRDGVLVFFEASSGKVLMRISVGYGLWGRRMAFSSRAIIAVAGARGVTAFKLFDVGGEQGQTP
jgi:WD40 repeat protein